MLAFFTKLNKKFPETKQNTQTVNFLLSASSLKFVHFLEEINKQKLSCHAIRLNGLKSLKFMHFSEEINKQEINKQAIARLCIINNNVCTVCICTYTYVN